MFVAWRPASCRPAASRGPAPAAGGGGSRAAQAGGRVLAGGSGRVFAGRLGGVRGGTAAFRWGAGGRPGASQRRVWQGEPAPNPGYRLPSATVAPAARGISSGSLELRAFRGVALFPSRISTTAGRRDGSRSASSQRRMVPPAHGVGQPPLHDRVRCPCSLISSRAAPGLSPSASMPKWRRGPLDVSGLPEFPARPSSPNPTRCSRRRGTRACADAVQHRHEAARPALRGKQLFVISVSRPGLGLVPYSPAPRLHGPGTARSAEGHAE